MSRLIKEFYNVQNPALGAYLLSRFSCGYLKENQERTPMTLIFIVLPMIYKQEIADFISSTRKVSGLHFLLINLQKKE